MDRLSGWGCIGENSWGTLTGFPGVTASQGVVRTVGPCTRYEKYLPLREVGLPEWKSDSNDPRRYGMPLQVPPAEVSSLYQLGEDLRGNPPRSGNDPRIAELQDVATRLLEVGEELHRRGWRLGLLSPRNVLFVRGNGRQLILPDAGFVSTDPDWEHDWLQDAEFADLYHPLKPAEQHRLDHLPQTTPVPDVRMVARLLICVLLGGRDPRGVAPATGRWQVLTRVPSPQEAPALGADVWAVLDDAAGGDVPTFEDFAVALREHPLREHFDWAPSRQRDGGRGVWLAAVAAVLVVGLPGLYLWHRPREKPPHVAPEPIDCTRKPEAPLPPHSKLVSLSGDAFATLPLPNQIGKLVELYAAERSAKPEVRQREEHHLEHARWLALQKLRAEMLAMIESAEKDPQPVLRRALHRSMTALEQMLRELQKWPASEGLLKEENACLERLRSLSEQLEP